MLDWLICGEFPVEKQGAEGAEIQPPFDPATEPREGAICPRPDGTVARWFRIHGSTTTGPHVDLGDFFAIARPTDDVTGYAFTSFPSRGGEAHVLVAADGPLSIWLNGKLIHQAHPRRFRQDSEIVRVDLLEGTNRVLIGVASGEGGGWRFSMRIANHDQAFPTPETGDAFLLYGRPAHSRGREDVLIRHFFAGKKDGIFVDVGSGHFRKENNTLVLEREFGWTGLALDALEEFASGYAEHRPGTRFVSCLVGEQDEGFGEFYRAETTVVSSTDKRWAETEAGKVQATKLRVAYRTLTSLLEEHGIERLDLLSMDIELAEPGALAGFDIDRFRPALVCIEANVEVAAQIAEYFRNHGYERIHEYLPFDGVNWYFTPLD